MAGKFENCGEDEEDVLASKEPQVTSQDPDERKAARALRIKRRQEAIKKAEAPSEEASGDEEPGFIEQATANAAEELQRLALDGAAKVTNVKVTTDEREVIRRALFTEKTNKSYQKIEDEATEAQIQYEAITLNWDAILLVKDPLDIDFEMKEQKRHCDELLDQKNELISELKKDLETMDKSYYEDLEKQDKDIKELSERVDKQIRIMQKAYDKQLSLIEQAINIERDAIIGHNNKRWEALYRQRDKEELAHIDYKFEQVEVQKQEIEAIMWDHHEKYRRAKIELELLLQELQKELEKLKATCIINTEKIGYNYQILKKREEENVFVKSQQKRKLNKMSDVANKLRAKIHKAAEDGAIEELKSDAEIVKLMQTMDDLEKKSNQFSHVNHYKFSQVWRMAAARCAELSRDLRQCEVSLHAHILSEPPPAPPPHPPKSPLSKYEHDEETPAPKPEQSTDNQNQVAKDAKEKLVRHILELVADNTGFLVEDRLLKLIAKYNINSQNLCTLDAIFMALEIQSEEDVELLCSTFLTYAFCPICVGMETESEMMGASSCSPEESQRASLNVKAARGDRGSLRGRASCARSVSASTSRSAHIAFRSHELSPDDQILMAEADEILQKCGDPQASTFVTASTSEAGSGSGKRAGARGVTVTTQLDESTGEHRTANPFLCPVGHNLEIEPMQVLTALGEFISVFVPPDKRKLYDILDNVKPPNFSSPSRKLSTDDIVKYWEQWMNLFPPEKDRFWDGLLTGLNNYLPILQERERLHDEVMHLRRRNAALRRIVHGALPELPAAAPKYARPYPATFTASFPDDAHDAFAKLPPI